MYINGFTGFLCGVELVKSILTKDGTMFKIERIRQIKEILKDCGQIDVSSLSSLLNVSDATIRNDLEELEKEGFLTRFHGGATINTTENDESSIAGSGVDFIEYDKNKEDIGIIASRLIREREWIFLGPGTTSYYIAKALRERSNINVLTNNFAVADILRDVPNIKVLFLGGQLEHHGFYTIPDDLGKELHNYYVDKAFFSTDGLDLNAGYTLSDTAVYEIILMVMERSRETIMAVDCSKFDQRAFMKIGDIDLVKTVITNVGIPDDYKRYFIEHGIRVYTSYDLRPITF